MIEPTIEILGRLIGYPTVSTDSNLELVDYAVDVLTEAGFGVTTTTEADGIKANVFGTIGPQADGGVVLSGHTDVVPVAGQHWTRDPFRAVVDHNRVWGRGSSDMKGFIACVLALAPTIRAADLTRPLHVALTFDEEEGCHGAKVMLEELSRTGPRPEAAIIGEPTGMVVVGAHKGCYEFTTEIIGVERHASMAAADAGAIHAAAKYIGVLDSLRTELEDRAPADSPFQPPCSTINVGTIAGGVARNISAGSAKFDWELRPVRADDAAFVTDRVDCYVTEVLLPQMRREYAQADVSRTTVGAVEAFRLEPDSPAIALAQCLTGSEGTEVVSYGTEAGLFQHAGISAVVCGPGRIEQAHRADEYIEISQLEASLTMLSRLVDELKDGRHSSKP